MNKQELKEKLVARNDDVQTFITWQVKKRVGYANAIRFALDLIDQLDEPEITEEQAWQKIAESTNLTVERLKKMSVDQSQLEALQSESKRCSGMELAELLSIVENNGFNEPIKSDKSIKRDDVLDRLQEIGEHNRNEWIEVILHVFGDDYGTAKYREGYEQGVLNGILTSNKNKLVEVPQFVADWIEGIKSGEIPTVATGGDDLIFEICQQFYEETLPKELRNWFEHNVNSHVFYNAVLYGYTIEPPKTLQVIVKKYDSTVFKTDIPEDEAMKLIEGWKEDE